MSALLLWLAVLIGGCNTVTVPDGREWTIDLTPIAWRVGRVVWVSADVRGAVDGTPQPLGPQRPYTLRGDEARITTQGAPPYDVAVCWAHAPPAWAGWRVALPHVEG